MADEQLRMTAEVVDKFSKPLRQLRDELKNVRPPAGARDIENQFGKAAKAAASAAAEIRTGLSAALTGIGVTALGATGAIAGLVAAIRGTSQATAALQAFSRETGITAQKLRSIEALGGRFGIDPDAMKSGVQSFTNNLYDIRRRYGETYGWLQATSPKFAEQLFSSKSNEEALGKTLGYLSQFKDATQRQRAAEKLFGSGIFGRLGAEGLEKLMQQWREVERDLGKLPPGAEKSAEDFERSMKSLSDTLRGLRDANAMPVILELDKALKGLGEGLKSSGFAEWLGKETKQFVIDVKNLIAEINALLVAMGKLGRFSLGNGVDGKSGGNYGNAGPLGNPHAFFNPPRDSMDLTQKNRQLERLEEIIQRKEGAGEDASSTKKKRDALVEEIRALREKIKEGVREGVKDGFSDSLIQKQSFLGGDGGAKIWNASLGGAGRSFGGNPSGGGDMSADGSSGQPRVHGGGPSGGLPRLKFNGSEVSAIGGKAGKLSTNQREAYDSAIAEGLSPKAARALVANMTGEALHKPGDHHWDVKHMSQGIVQWDPQRSAAIKKQFGKEPRFMSVADQTKAAIWEINNNRRFAQTKAALAGNNADQMLDALVRNYEVPANIPGEINKRTGIYNKLGNLHAQSAGSGSLQWPGIWKKKGMSSNPSGLDDNGLSRMGDSLMLRGAGAQKVEGEARIQIDLNGAPKGTKLSSDATGMFKQVDLNRGRQMNEGDEI